MIISFCVKYHKVQYNNRRSVAGPARAATATWTGKGGGAGSREEEEVKGRAEERSRGERGTETGKRPKE